MTTPNQDPSSRSELPRSIEEELALQGARDAVEGRPMDNLMHGKALVDESAADLIERVNRSYIGTLPPSEEETAVARKHAAEIADLDIHQKIEIGRGVREEREAAARRDLLGE